MAADVRKPPVGAVFRLHQQDTRGWCNWCGTPVKEKTSGRGWLKWWHDACEEEYQIIIKPDAARRAVFARDKGVCCDCEENWGDRYLLRAGQAIITSPEWDVCRRWTKKLNEAFHAERALGYWRYTELIYVSLWHVDHKIPLWKVVHLEPLQRLEYFKLHNLITRCHRCHAFKTAEEAAERAKYKRLGAAAPTKPKTKWASQKLQSRSSFPPKGSRPMRRKT